MLQNLLLVLACVARADSYCCKSNIVLCCGAAAVAFKGHDLQTLISFTNSGDSLALITLENHGIFFLRRESGLVKNHKCAVIFMHPLSLQPETEVL